MANNNTLCSCCPLPLLQLLEAQHLLSTITYKETNMSLGALLVDSCPRILESQHECAHIKSNSHPGQLVIYFIRPFFIIHTEDPASLFSPPLKQGAFMNKKGALICAQDAAWEEYWSKTMIVYNTLAVVIIIVIIIRWLSLQFGIVIIFLSTISLSSQYNTRLHCFVRRRCVLCNTMEKISLSTSVSHIYSDCLTFLLLLLCKLI